MRFFARVTSFVGELFAIKSSNKQEPSSCVNKTKVPNLVSVTMQDRSDQHERLYSGSSMPTTPATSVEPEPVASVVTVASMQPLDVPREPLAPTAAPVQQSEVDLQQGLDQSSVSIEATFIKPQTVIKEPSDPTLETESIPTPLIQPEPFPAPIALEADAPEPEAAPVLLLTQATGTRFAVRILCMEGSSSHDYQDAAQADPETGFAAIADGTTLGGYSSIVSNEAVMRFVEDECDLDDESRRNLWWATTRNKWYRKQRESYNNASSVEQSRWDKGGSATFMGLHVRHDSSYALHMVGDCSMFWFDHTLKNCIHIDGATAFNSHPEVLHTENADTPLELHKNHGTHALLAPVALLVTDALAKFLQETAPWETDPDFAERLRSHTAEQLRDWLLPEKQAYRLDADDYTFIFLTFPISTKVSD